MAKTSKKRLRLLLELEHIVGGQCYNGNIQNWGPGGVYEGEGRKFRYPVTFTDAKGGRVKRWGSATDVPDAIAMTGYYAFGANQLSIVRAIDKVLEYLERNYALKLDG